MAYDYDKLYGETPQALGQPTPIIVEFFDRLALQHARVLDVGCGQGRDALFIATRGHTVVGVDISPNGIRDLVATAARDNLSVQGVVADIVDYQPDGLFDVVLVDRTLHMLPRAQRIDVLEVLLDHVDLAGWLLIADERSNIPEFANVVEKHRAEWSTELRRGGYLFIRRNSRAA